MSRNEASEAIWIANVTTVWGGEDIYMDAAEAKRYDADPDAYAAKHFGLTKIEYYQWLDTEGAPLCSHRTAAGDNCRNRTGGSQLVPRSWKIKHRKLLCVAHGGKASRKK
jgi:hypothetical protein